jgi:hypothetical protein
VAITARSAAIRRLTIPLCTATAEYGEVEADERRRFERDLRRRYRQSDVEELLLMAPGR